MLCRFNKTVCSRVERSAASSTISNARSVCDVRQVGKATLIRELIEVNDLDVIAITDTWLNLDDSVFAGCITPAGYQL